MMAPMAKLISSAITSLDGYVADQAGEFDWAVPDERRFGNGVHVRYRTEA